MTGISAVEFNHCRELAMPPGSLFEFTSSFLQAEQLEPVLAVYALRQAICSIPGSPVDEEVKWAKLKWWGEELLADPDSPSRHPVLRALRQSGARSRIGDSLLLGLVNEVAGQIDVAPSTDEQAMFDRFAGWGTAGIKLELALGSASIDKENLDFISAASSLFQLVSSFGPGQRRGTDQIPMSILAEFNVSVKQLQEDLHSAESEQIVSKLATLGGGWFSEGLSDLQVSSVGESVAVAGEHLQLRWAMEERTLKRIRKDANGFLQEGLSCGPVDAWFAWRFLRQLK